MDMLVMIYDVPIGTAFYIMQDHTSLGSSVKQHSCGEIIVNEDVFPFGTQQHFQEVMQVYQEASPP